MATKVEKVDDIDGSTPATTFRLTDCDTGETWEIDLSAEHGPKGRKVINLTKFVEKGRPVQTAVVANIGDAATRALVGKMRNRP